MKKTGQKIFENPSDNQLKTTTIQSVQQASSKLALKQSDKYPNRLICFVKIKIYPSQRQSSIIAALVKLKGTGCLISDKYLLTAAHNLYEGYEIIERMKNIKQKYEDQSYVRQGLGKGKQHQSYINEFKVEDYIINPKYMIEGKKTSPVEDFALLKLQTEENHQPQAQFMPIVHLSDKSLSQLKSVSLNGYPLDFNKQQANNSSDQTSLYINFQFGAQKKLKKVENNKIIYNIPAQVGSSGGPLVTLFQNKHIIIGIHKGSFNKDEEKKEVKSQQSEQESIGVSAGQMLEFLNEKGYEFRRRPFVYTQNTLYLFDKVNQLQTISFLYLANKTLQSFDILVFTAFDMSNISYLTLSYNSLTEIGVGFLLRRKFPNMKSLYLHQNKIERLQDIPEENWKNIETATHLGLSMNLMKAVPIGLKHLKGLKQLWLSSNLMQVVSENLELICQGNDRENSTIYLYDNLSGSEMEKEKGKIEELSKYKTKMVWQNKKQATQAKT